MAINIISDNTELHDEVDEADERYGGFSAVEVDRRGRLESEIRSNKVHIYD